CGEAYAFEDVPSIVVFVPGPIWNLRGSGAFGFVTCSSRTSIHRMIDAGLDLKGRDMIRIADWNGAELTAVLDLADRLKALQARHEEHHLLPGRSLGLVFEKPSLRTRVSFEVGIAQLGGVAVHLPGPEIGLGRRETTRDMAYVLSRYLDAILIRTFE